MYIVHVHVKVKEDQINDFIEATKENARISRKEDGIVKFDFIQKIDEPSRFILIEVYRTDQDPGKHKETAHYKIWREKVESMMAVPRQSEKFVDIFPD